MKGPFEEHPKAALVECTLETPDSSPANSHSDKSVCRGSMGRYFEVLRLRSECARGSVRIFKPSGAAAGAILPHARERATKERIAPTKSASTNRPKNTTVTSAPKSFGPPMKCPPETIE